MYTKRQRKAYLLRWNPNISPYSRERYEEDFTHYLKTGHEPEDMNWTIYEHSEVKSGDIYFMAQVGCKVNGIVWAGFLEDEPYDMEDYKGRKLPRKFIDITYFFMQNIENKMILTANRLKEVVPEIDWDKGPSGILLSPEVAEKLAMEVANQLLHAEEDENLKFAEYEEKQGIIEDIVGYLCPRFKQRLYESNRIDKQYQEMLKDENAFNVTDATIKYDEQKATTNTSIEDIAILEKRRCTRILRGMLEEHITLILNS